jgi:hypothetical protein
MAFSQELLPEFAIVVYLAVEDDREGTILVKDRLIACIEVNDPEAPHAEAHKSGEVVAR